MTHEELSRCEWQLIDKDTWIFGLKIRGLVRERLAEVYFDEEIKREGDPEYGWVWFSWVHGICIRGVAHSLSWAVEEAEQALLRKEIE